MLLNEVLDGHQRIPLHGGSEMIRTFAKQLLALALCLLLVLGTGPFAACAQQPAQQSGAGYSGQGAPLTADELQQLVAPIALYPDALVAQVLGAATFPDQVEAAAGWLQQNQNLTGNNLMTVVNQQPWDPSLKALTQFPSVLENLAKNLGWTSALGEAYHTQSADVMGAIQVLRAKAQAAGNLKSGSQIVVVQESPQTIVIQPANPQIVYVPTYNPAVVYGYPYVTPGYSSAAVVTTAVVAFGVGIAVGAMMSGGYYGWGYSSWDCNWHSTTVVYHGGAYYGNAAWHGGAYGSVGYGSVSHYGSSYNPYTGTYARGGTASNGDGSVSAGQAYNPRTGASASTVQGSNAYGSYGASTASKNGNTTYAQHQTTYQGTTAQAHTTNGGQAYGASGRYGNSAAVGQTANGDKYASANGNTYKNTGSGWSGNSNNTAKYSGSNYSAASRGWGGQDRSGGSSAFSGDGGGGWQSRSDSARGSSSFGGGGGWGGRGGGGRR
jgi:Protein of unknown function (DUF3300)